MDLVKGLFEGSRLALARSITAVENEYENAIFLDEFTDRAIWSCSF